MSAAVTNGQYRSEVFPFEECLAFMEKVGKSIYGNRFRVYAEDYTIIFKLLVYFFRDRANANSLKISLSKGILLTGPVGVGKTSLMSLLNYFLSPQAKYILRPCREIAFEFLKDGFETINKYGNGSFVQKEGSLLPRSYCFDDLGVEQTMVFFGNETNVIGEILLSRYDKFISHGMLTHGTTNLTAPELEARYGHRVRSRLREMFNLVSFEKNAPDKRK